MKNEMTAGEAAEILNHLANTDYVDYDNALEAMRYSASILRRVASGELAEVVHGHAVLKHRHIGSYKYADCPECRAEIEIEHPVECDIPYCSNCGAQLAESFQNVCPRCGAILDGKDDSHE
ncbi:MAG: hypothetical protein WC900_07560 [Oscillospiraceae bacterium]|jgi:hypothetical protein